MKASFVKGTTGILATAGGIGISHAVVNEWLQTISFLVGIAVGVASFISIVRNKKNKSKKPRYEL
jgi:hypothetical protein